MKATSPYTLVRSVKFNQSRSIMPSPDGMWVSPNGRFVSICDSERIYVFDLFNPDASWLPLLVRDDDIYAALPTDKGNCWVVCRRNCIMLAGQDGSCVMRFDHMETQGQVFWGNDSWILQHDGCRIACAELGSMRITRIDHKLAILHAWFYEGRYRLLSISRNKGCLFLHEWDPRTGRKQLLGKLKCKVDVGMNGAGAEYAFLHSRCFHAWPEEDGSITVHLAPGRVHVAVDGGIEYEDSPCDWRPISRAESPLDAATLGCATVAALTDGIDPRAPFGSNIPYLIATMQTNDSLHVITTLWHKKMSLEHAAEIDIGKIEELLEEDQDLGRLILVSCSNRLPKLRGIISTVLNDLESFKCWSQAPDYLRQREGSILTLFRDLLLDCDVEEVAQASPKKMLESLVSFSRFPGFLQVVFEVLDVDRFAGSEAKDVFEYMVRSLIPLLPTDTVNQLPERLRRSPIPIFQTLDDWPQFFDPDDMDMFIEKAAARTFNINRVLRLISFCMDGKRFSALETLLARLAKRKAWIRSVPLKKRRLLGQLIVQMIQTDAYREKLASLWAFYLQFAQSVNLPASDFVRLLDADSLPLLSIAEWIAEHAKEGCSDENKIIPHLVDKASSSRLIPGFIRVMAYLNTVDCVEKLQYAVAVIFVGGKSTAVHTLAETLWQVSRSLEPEYRRLYAITLQSALLRCRHLPNHTLTRPSSRNALFTAEAELLNRSLMPVRCLDEINTWAGRHEENQS